METEAGRDSGRAACMRQLSVRSSAIALQKTRRSDRVGRENAAHARLGRGLKLSASTRARRWSSGNGRLGGRFLLGLELRTATTDSTSALQQ